MKIRIILFLVFVSVDLFTQQWSGPSTVTDPITRSENVGIVISQMPALGNTTNNPHELLTIFSSGNLGIGTTNPSGHLHIRDSPYWSSNNLISLPKLESISNKTNTYPRYPLPKNLEAEGMKLKEMSLMLLKKVEELTFYVVEQQKRITKIENQNNK